MMKLIKLIHDNNIPINYHSCVDASEFYLLFNNNCTVTISYGNKKFSLPPPCMIALCCREKINIHIDSHGKKSMLWCLRVPKRFVPELNAKVYLDKHNAKLHNNMVILRASILPGFFEIFMSLIAFSPPQDKENESQEYSYMIMYILMWFSRSFEKEPSYRKISVSGKVYNLIINDLSLHWTLRKVADQLFMSESTLKRKLKNEGASFSKIYNDARMIHAKRLLENNPSGLKIKKIAQMCGFRNESYFITCFKNTFGLTPAAYTRIAGIT
ncbi:helix-turn-helix transcriptional regulator [Escherichia coli]|uniref:helix-turn-helix transcriptional regulator n=1 Tax=Escherichia coli TaxID=562 RepID=UPI000E1D9EF1|nr:helix-turn-helix transcriptional regulator [Escherichia coli]EEZ6201426.1 helix-turn-helix transcriptional regulator [Escherichia coli O8]EFN7279899.1 AraC family transcriptional regulator [Escherichia coli O11:H5]EHK5475568.1 helix-turn-helix transcriptional regulator [Escherichia coli]EHK6606353.1 helix-turn-helix transcriptional regulator [Escherichia coli]MBB8121648.1 helix-turn-helix transcriptional regulator [Escherichia coli]